MKRNLLVSEPMRGCHRDDRLNGGSGCCADNATTAARLAYPVHVSHFFAGFPVVIIPSSSISI